MFRHIHSTGTYKKRIAQTKNGVGRMQTERLIFALPRFIIMLIAAMEFILVYGVTNSYPFARALSIKSPSMAALVDDTACSRYTPPL